MALTKTQLSIVTKAQSVGGGDVGITLDDASCVFLVGTIARDIGLLQNFPELPKDFPAFFSSEPPNSLSLRGDFLALFERLVVLRPETETYFSCLAALLKSRLKYYRILESQPFPTMDQVGPRSLLQYGQMTNAALATFLQWRKWLFDIDNRAGQETGYLFEPIIAHAIGGLPVSSKKSPVKRSADSTKARQVDCLRGKDAYEIKIRLTIAASGQGRWREELDFPRDCRTSGYRPVLVVLDPTPNPKLAELTKAFVNEDGLVFVGDKAWGHLDEAAGPTMARFIEGYVRTPIAQVLAASEEFPLDIALSVRKDEFKFKVREEEVSYRRKERKGLIADIEEMPEDVDEESPGA